MDAGVKNELFTQQSPRFTPTAVCSSREPSGYNPSRQLDYGHNDLYSNNQPSQQNPHFQTGNVPFSQRPLHPALPQTASGQFSFAKPAIQQHPQPAMQQHPQPMQQHPQHPFPHPYAIHSHPDERRRVVGDELWRMPSSEFNIDNQHGTWMSGRNPSHSAPSFGQEGKLCY